MKVLLIASNTADSPYPVYPLGMGMIARALEDAGHIVMQFDFLASGMDLEALDAALKDFSPDLVGVSMRNIDNVNLLNEQRYTGLVKKIVDRVRIATDANVVLGGTAFSIMPETMLAEIGADYGIVGEGERLIVELADKIGKGTVTEKILRGEPSLTGTQIKKAVYDREMMSFYLNSGGISNVQTKRGCPYNCVYCSYPDLEGRRFRPRDVNEVIDDIVILKESHDAKMLFFTDSVFNDDKGYYVHLLEKMAERGVSVPWSAYIRPQRFDKYIIDLMKKTGVKGVEIGADAASDTALKGIGKSFSWNDVIDCNNVFADNGIATSHFFMFGGPCETEETVLLGIDNVINLKRTVSFMFMGIRILPDTPLKNLAVKQGIIDQEDDLLEPRYYTAPGLDRDWMERTMKERFKPYRHCVFPPDALENSVKFLQKLGHKGLLWDMLIPES